MSFGAGDDGGDRGWAWMVLGRSLPRGRVGRLLLSQT